MTALIRAELLKLRSAPSTWWAASAMVVATLGALAVHGVDLHSKMIMIRGVSNQVGDPSDLYELAHGRQEDVYAQWAADLYTSGRYLAMLLALALGVQLVASEFSRHTIANTFLVAPRREQVMLAKFVTSVLAAAVLFAVNTVIGMVGGLTLLKIEQVDAYLDRAEVWQAVGLTLVGYLGWAALGTGLGCLIRRPVLAVGLALPLYLIGAPAINAIFPNGSTPSATQNLTLLVPSVASERMLLLPDVRDAPPIWMAIASLVGYVIVLGVSGSLLMKRRDI